MDIYMQNAGYAREHGELGVFRESKRTNVQCKKAIEKAVRDNFDGMHLKGDCVKPVMEQFGVDRVEFVLASTVQYKDWDGRFSRSNKSWANSIQTVNIFQENEVYGLWEHAVDSHPAVLDGFINLARKEITAERTNPQTRPSALKQLDSLMGDIRSYSAQRQMEKMDLTPKKTQEVL